MFISMSYPGQCNISYIVIIVISFVLLCYVFYCIPLLFDMYCNKVMIKKILACAIDLFKVIVILHLAETFLIYFFVL